MKDTEKTYKPIGKFKIFRKNVYPKRKKSINL